MSATMTAPLLACAALTRRFGGLVALDRVDLAVADGEIVGLIGPNGSGKTTLFNVVTGIYAPDDGTIAFAGADITGARPQAVYRAGIARTFQRSRMCLPLSVFDNIMVGNHKRLDHGLVFNLLRRGAFAAEFRRSWDEAAELVAIFNPALAARLDEPASRLAMIDRRRIEICRALISRPRLLLLDEPSAGMTHEETRELMDDILRRARAHGRPHHRDHRARDGRDRAHHQPLRRAQLRPQDQRRHVRRDRGRPRRAGRLPGGRLVSARLDIAGVTAGYDRADVLDGVTLAVEPGRITCLLGANGSGKTTLIRAILGLTPPRAGRISLDGRDIAGLADPPGDRGRHRLHPGRPQGVSQVHRRGEPARRRLSGNVRGGDARAHRRDLRHLPAALASGARSSPAPCRAASRRWCRSAAG